MYDACALQRLQDRRKRYEVCDQGVLRICLWFRSFIKVDEKTILSNKAAVFVLLGQSNAVGHKVPMDEKDQIREPLKNVFGLKREDNQSFTNEELCWSGYTSD